MKTKTLLFLLFFTISLSYAQNVIWHEDFNDGPLGWNFSTSLCGDFSGSKVGTWQLTSATFNGVAIANIESELQISSLENYIAKVTIDGNSAFVQSKYTENADSFLSGVEPTNLLSNDYLYGEHDSFTDWLTINHLTPTQLSQGGTTALLIGDPAITVSGDEMTITSSDGQVVLTYIQVTSCGTSWTWHHYGDVRNGLYTGADDYLNMPDEVNGAMVFNYDYLITKGSTPFDGNYPLPMFKSEMISPVIDCSSVNANEVVVLEIKQRIKTFVNAQNSAENQLYVSTDGGNTWGEPVGTNVGVTDYDTSLMGVEKIVLSGIGGESNVRIKLVYNQSFYFWMFDDIRLLVDDYFSNPTIVENSINRLPAAQTPDFLMRETTFYGDVENTGTSPAENISLSLSITKGYNEEEIYSSSLNQASLPATGTLEETAFNGDFYPIIYPYDITHPHVGAHTATYELDAEDITAVSSDLTYSWNFWVTINTWAKAKDIYSVVKPAEMNDFSMGNIYYVPITNVTTYENSNTSTFIMLNNIEFSIDNPSDLVGENIEVILYEWNGDMNGDNLINTDEYEEIFREEYVFNGQESSSQFIQVDCLSCVLEPGKYYIPVLKYVDETGGDKPCYVGAATNIDYGPTMDITAQNGIPEYAACGYIGADDNPNFELNLFGTNVVPAIQLDVDLVILVDDPVSVSNTGHLLKEGSVRLQPNIVKEQAIFYFGLEQSLDVDMAVVNKLGQVLLNQNIGVHKNGQYVLDVAELPTGQYWAKFMTENGSATLPMIVVD